MAIKVEVVTPVSVVSAVEGASTAISVVGPTQSPITTNREAAVVNVVGANMVQNVVVSTTEPSNPYEGLVWIDIS